MESSAIPVLMCDDTICVVLIYRSGRETPFTVVYGTEAGGRGAWEREAAPDCFELVYGGHRRDLVSRLVARLLHICAIGATTVGYCHGEAVSPQPGGLGPRNTREQEG